MSRNRIRHSPAVLTAMLALALAPASALAETTAPAPTAPVAPAPPSPSPGRMALALKGAGGSPPFALPGQRIALHGLVTPYVAGQTVKVSFYRDGRRVQSATVTVLAGPSATAPGEFRTTFLSGYMGVVQARVAHEGTTAQSAFTASSQSVRYVSSNLGPGAQGQSVRLLQSELNVLHFAVPLSGYFDEGTGQALIAYRKMTGLERVPYAGRHLFELIERGAGKFHVRYPRDGHHFEADLYKQVLVEIEAGGRVQRIYMMSSGKPSTPTVLGRFSVYRKEPGVNGEGMVDSNYFISGYAIHGYPEVPTYAASHGCLRVPIPDAPAIYAWAHGGTPVDVYN